MNANTRLAPGDMVSVDPSAIRFLRYPERPPAPVNAENKQVGTTAEESELGEPDIERTSSHEDELPLKTRPQAELPPGQPWLHNQLLTPFTLPDYAAPFIFIPAYIEPSFLTCSAVYVRHPTARPGYSEIPTPYDADGEIVRLAWEWYAKRRPRMRSRRRLSRMPEDRTKMLST